MPGVAFASAPTDSRLIIIYLNGGLDGLAAIAPYGDPAYAETRGMLAFQPPGQGIKSVTDLDGFYGLHPSLAPLLPLYKKGILAPIHAVANMKGNRSHTNCIKMLENGTGSRTSNLGWMSRFLQAMNMPDYSALSISSPMHLSTIAIGNQQILSWAPHHSADTSFHADISSMAHIYAQDPILAKKFEAGLRSRKLAEAAKLDTLFPFDSSRNISTYLEGSVRAAASLLSQENGPRIAMLGAGGYDTHVNQGLEKSRLQLPLADLSNALLCLPEAMGSAWKNTLVLVTTEFGRTIRHNGSMGTDHGTATIAFAMGEKVRGGKVYGKWPGIRDGDAFEQRDLMPTTDVFSLFSTVLYEHFGVQKDALNSTIFPGSDAPMLKGLLS